MQSIWDDLPSEGKERIELGAASYQSLLKRSDSIERWHEVGTGLAELQTQAMSFARSNQPKGKGYNRHWLALAEHWPGVIDMHRSARSHAIWLATNWDDINAWLWTLPHNLRLKLQHPTTIRQQWAVAQRGPAEKKPKAEAEKQTLVGMLAAHSDEEIVEAVRQVRKPDARQQLAEEIIATIETDAVLVAEAKQLVADVAEVRAQRDTHRAVMDALPDLAAWRMKEEKATPSPSPSPMSALKHRGRPKGSKNKPKAEASSTSANGKRRGVPKGSSWIRDASGRRHLVLPQADASVPNGEPSAELAGEWWTPRAA